MSRPTLRILIIDDDAARAAILEEGLRAASDGVDGRAYDVHHVRDRTNLLARMAAVDPDAVLIALESPSRATLEELFDIARLARRPIAMFVDKSDGAAVQAAIDAGVSAYVVDGLRKERVSSILDVAMRRFHAVERLRRELEEAKSALEERKIVEQAKAILMRQRGCSEDEAYGLLRRTAMNQNRKIAELAQTLVTAAALIGARREQD